MVRCAARRGPNPQPGGLRYLFRRASRFDFGPQGVFSFVGTRDKSRVRIRVNESFRRFAPISLGHQSIMSITVQLDLSEALAAKARAKGLLNPAHLTELIARELAEEKDTRDFFQMARDIRSLPGEPMTMDEIQQIVDEVRAERAAREAGR